MSSSPILPKKAKQRLTVTIFQESKSGASFNEKDFKALKGCLAHLYGIHFDTRADCIDSENSNGYISSDVELAKYQVRLHAMAEKYKMQDLSERTRIVLAGLAKELLHQNAEAFLEVVKYIWTANKIHDKSLRRAVADVLVADYVEHEEFEKLVKVNSNIPGLEPDLRLARQIRLAPDMLNASEDSSQTRQSRKAPSRVVVYDEGYDR